MVAAIVEVKYLAGDTAAERFREAASPSGPLRAGIQSFGLDR